MAHDDLDDLIGEANTEVEQGIQRALKAKPKAPLSRQLAPFFPAAIFLLAGAIYFSQRPEQTSRAEMATELTALLQQARDSVEQNVVDGQYPPVLPNAALGAVVDYDVFRGGYFLSVQSGGLLVEMNNAGQITVNGLQ